jgi:triacylglycerol lipase
VLPEVTWDAIAPPYRTYHYFQDGEAFPFRPRATGCDLVNAWWLIEAATLAYAEEDFVRERLTPVGLGEVTWFSVKGTQGYVAGNQEVIIVAFRGTEVRPRPGPLNFGNVVADCLTDVDIRLVDSGGPGQVHHGFKQALDEVWEGLHQQLDAYRADGNRTLWFTGHSLGAALATLAAQRYGPACTLYTFGSPRVGDLKFKNGLGVNAFRFVNHWDVVTRVPPPDPYHHVGELCYIDHQGLIHPHPGRGDGAGAGGEEADVVDFLAPASRGLIPQGILDHVPLFYATHIWNNIA